MLYDTVHKIEDFEHMLSRHSNKSLLRMTIEEIGISEMAVKVSIILTIPFKNCILRHYIGKRIFNRYFYRSKDFQENKDYTNFVEECIKKATEKFGNITEGFWEDN